MSKENLHTSAAPKAVGPYSQAVKAGGFLFTAGQVAIDPEKGTLIDGDVSQQTAQVMRNISAILSNAGLSAADVVKTTVFLADMADFAAMNAVYGEFFAADPPARSTVQAALPLGALVEIETVAIFGS